METVRAWQPGQIPASLRMMHKDPVGINPTVASSDQQIQTVCLWDLTVAEYPTKGHICGCCSPTDPGHEGPVNMHAGFRQVGV